MLLSVRNLHHQYSLGSSTIKVLQSLNLEVESGEFVSIMGASGSGKSTLMHILGCLIRPYKGSYFLGSTDILASSRSELAAIRASRIGFVFQMFHLLPAMSVLENVLLPFLYNETDEIRAKELSLQALEHTGLSHRLGHKPAELSGGEMQRVAIARALAVNPELILADEPTGNLDSKTGEEIMNLFSRLHAKGHTIILVTHDENVSNHAQRRLILHDGIFQ